MLNDQYHDQHRNWFRSRQAQAIALAVFLVTLPIGYPRLVGPAAYCLERDWMNPSIFAATYAPVLNALPRGSNLQISYFKYIDWWLKLAEKHDGN